MKLRECTYGRLIIDNKDVIGMVVGITNNCQSGDIKARADKSRVIPLIQFSHGETRGIHPANIRPLE